MGVRPRRETQLQKKTLIAAEQDRPDVARRRVQWTKYRNRIDPTRLVFIDDRLQPSREILMSAARLLQCPGFHAVRSRKRRALRAHSMHDLASR